LRWRANAVRHCFHVLPGETILELGAGSGLWTEHLSAVLRGENPITAAVFHDHFAEEGAQKNIPNAKFLRVQDLKDLPEASFDYVVGTAILCHDRYEENLRAIYRLLKPGGQMLFFEANYWNPQVFLKSTIEPIKRWIDQPDCQHGMRRYRLMQIASQAGFTRIQVVPYDIIHPLTPKSLIPSIQSFAVFLEHSPLVREVCGTLYIWAAKPGGDSSRRRPVNLANHPSLSNSISVVIPCHNEEMNIPRLLEALTGSYDRYIHEILVVDDCSTDATAEVTLEAGQKDPRVKLIKRNPPNGVGRALRDGYEAATGRYILTMDSDFTEIVPEFRDLFDAIAAGHDGAIGSRFSHESILMNYPFTKILCNRGFHLLLSLLLRRRVRDISNNLKLYRAEILKDLEIEQNHFAANVETGLKPLLAGYDIQEVPISWINRDVDMGTSSFHLLKVGPRYSAALIGGLMAGWGRARSSFRRAA
jgi:SAM-dependent methyltransferase